nr:M23 family metallopeptidase [Cryobacterium aureum]
MSHHGQDIRCAGRQKIPCYRGGTVQPWKHSAVVGQTLAIRHGLGDYSGYCHLINRIPKAGTVIATGAFVGEAATWGEFTGSAWGGPHVHTVHGNSSACVFGIGTDDPAPYILAAIEDSAPAADTITAVATPNIPVVPVKPLQIVKTPTMYLRNGETGEIAALTAAGSHRFATVEAYEMWIGTVAAYNGMTSPEYRVVQPPAVANLLSVDAVRFAQAVAVLSS